MAPSLVGLASVHLSKHASSNQTIDELDLVSLRACTSHGTTGSTANHNMNDGSSTQSLEGRSGLEGQVNVQNPSYRTHTEWGPSPQVLFSFGAFQRLDLRRRQKRPSAHIVGERRLMLAHHIKRSRRGLRHTLPTDFAWMSLLYLLNCRC